MDLDLGGLVDSHQLVTVEVGVDEPAILQPQATVQRMRQLPARGTRQLLAAVKRVDDVAAVLHQHDLLNEEVPSTADRNGRTGAADAVVEIGRASCRERVCQYV